MGKTHSLPTLHERCLAPRKTKKETEFGVSGHRRVSKSGSALPPFRAFRGHALEDLLRAHRVAALGRAREEGRHGGRRQRATRPALLAGKARGSGKSMGPML